MALAEQSNILYFTDSGPLGETGLDNPQGSIFAIDLGVSMLKPVIVGKLANPSGIAITQDEKAIFVAETSMNRILRVVNHASGVYHTSVFH